MTSDISTIERWMSGVIESRGDLRFEDLHIDSVNPAFAPKPMWLRGTVECFSTALRLRDERSWPFLVAAGISLRGSVTPLGINFSTFNDLEAELDDSPPSLYLFDPPASTILGDPDTREIRVQSVPFQGSNVRSFLRDWLDENDHEYRRSFWLLA